MRVDQPHRARLDHLAGDIAAQFAKLVFGHHEKAAIDEGLVRAFRLDRNLAVDEQAVFVEVGNQRRGARTGLLELFAKVQASLCSLDRKITSLNSRHYCASRLQSSA